MSNLEAKLTSKENENTQVFEALAKSLVTSEIDKLKLSFRPSSRSCVAESAICYARLESFSLALEEKIDTNSELVNKLTNRTSHFNEMEEDLTY